MHSQKHRQVSSIPFMQTKLKVTRTGWLSEPHPMERLNADWAQATEIAQEGPREPWTAVRKPSHRDDEGSGREKGERAETTNDQVGQKRKDWQDGLKGKQSSGDFFHDRKTQLCMQERCGGTGVWVAGAEWEHWTGGTYAVIWQVHILATCKLPT